MQVPVTVLNANTKRETGKKAQFANIAAAKAVADIIRTTLGPRSMLKMLLDPNGGIVLTNDGHAILREIDVTHPAAKSMIQLSRTQDEEVGDGTTSVIILAGEMLHMAEPFLEKNIHPTVIVRGFARALEDAIKVIDQLAFPIETDNREQMLNVVNSCIGTKFTHRFGTLMADLALDAVRCVTVDHGGAGGKEIDIKNYAKVEKIPGGTIEDCRVLKGVMFNKDVVIPGRMRRRIENPRILLLDCPLEYKKGENQTNVELTKEEDWAALLKQEEEQIQRQCEQIMAFKPDVVITEKGLSDLAAHYLTKAGVSAIRRLRKTDNNRIARACGATIVNRTDEIRDSDIGTGAGLFEVVKIGDEFFTFIVDCKAPKACTVLLRGASKDILNEVERNLTDAMGVARNICLEPRLVPGGGACEMAISRGLADRAPAVEGVEQWPYKAVGVAMEVIPRTLAQNCGANVIRTLTKLRAKHAESPGCSWGIDGETGEVKDMKALGVWEPYQVKAQTIKTAIESAQMLLRIDDIVSGLSKKDRSGGPRGGAPEVEDHDNVDSERMLAE
ncbi:hypothetical protein HYH03_015733 [Edaphochlamys debaryana]|uniref:T-complex protein 1 subunit gamma n=1 Tax=Edaphochlamys debaryana TaxID=47281 RepID=A0A835XT95_9CHLO|nr:hypothetical protein HYH03_015733 [Edaphochlamys debaryana]|eukprot:KAG2485569.1 hypothetical protein HYH03_015733 [Edaphochlamys debaryana]